VLENLFRWLNDTSLAETVRANPLMFPWLESVHVLAITLVVGSIAAVDLRLLGLASRSQPITKLVRDILPLTWISFVVAVLTGTTLFMSNAVDYAHNVSMQLKMLLLVIAGLNMLVFHFVTYRSVGAWADAARAPLPVRLAGAASLVLWIGVVVSGRWIGFVSGA
jgi:hypothetical protein